MVLVKENFLIFACFRSIWCKNTRGFVETGIKRKKKEVSDEISLARLKKKKEGGSDDR